MINESKLNFAELNIIKNEEKEIIKNILITLENQKLKIYRIQFAISALCVDNNSENSSYISYILIGEKSLRKDWKNKIFIFSNDYYNKKY